MKPVSDFRRLALVVAIVAGTIAASAGVSAAQSLSELNRRLDALEPQVSEGMTNPEAASSAISQLDEAEADFAKIADGARSSSALLGTYERLEEMLNRTYTVWQKKKDACIQTLDSGGSCDYDQPEQLALRALYPLSWLRFEGAALHSYEPATARRLLNQAIDGFTDSTLIILNPELVRENLLGRAFAERELGKYQRAEYSRAIADFKRITQDGAGTRQYRAAEQGLATTYAAMGRMDQAQGLTAKLAESATGAQKHGLEMLRLREMFKQEVAASDSAHRAELHQQIVEFARAREHDKDSWAVVVATAADSLENPSAEFGNSDDPFVNWLLANVLYYKHLPLAAANYYWAAARSGSYPKAYKYAADLFYNAGRIDMVEKVAQEMTHRPSDPDAQWAAYIMYKIPRVEWERAGMKNAALENRWVAAANDYLKNYPHGQYAYEPHFRLGELDERKGDYLQAARQYEQVSGNSGYDFTARFNAAECYYRALAAEDAAAEKAAGANNSGTVRGPGPNNDREALKLKAIAALTEALKMEPNAERTAPNSQRKALHDSRGRAVFMLATLLEHEPHVDYKQVASLLGNYESQYPAMSAKFDEIFEWRITALDQTGSYAELDREAAAVVARDAPMAAHNDYLKEIGLDFWKSAQRKRAAADSHGSLEDVKLTAIVYGYFARQVSEGKMEAKSLTGTLSILGQAYLAMNAAEKAEATFNQVALADPGSPDANAGLARIAQSRKDYKDALERWSRVESLAAESDNLFYEAKYNMAEIFAQEGNRATACTKLAVTRSEHPNLGSPEMKEQWSVLQHKLCPNRTEG